MYGCGDKASSKRKASEKLIANVDFSKWIKATFKTSPDNRHIAYVTKEGNKAFVTVDGKKEKQYDGIEISGSIFSPDNKHVAYIAISGNKCFAVMDGKEGKQYDAIDELVFSPDSKFLAYKAQISAQWFVALDGKEGKRYDEIINSGSRTLTFDSRNNVHYLARMGDKIYMVENRI